MNLINLNQIVRDRQDFDNRHVRYISACLFMALMFSMASSCNAEAKQPKKRVQVIDFSKPKIQVIEFSEPLVIEVKRGVSK